MDINVHTHPFSLRTVLSREAARVMAQRLENAGVPDVLDRFLGDEG